MQNDNLQETVSRKPSVPVMQVIDGRACWKAFGRDEWVHEPELERTYMEAQQRIKAPFPFTQVKGYGIIPSVKPNNGGCYGNHRTAILEEGQENQLVLALDWGEAE